MLVLIEMQPVAQTKCKQLKNTFGPSSYYPVIGDFVLSSFAARHVVIHRLPCQGLYHITTVKEFFSKVLH